MTKRELNRDVKRLQKAIEGKRTSELEDYFNFLDKIAKPEFCRLISADNTFKSFSAESLRIIIRLNLSHRFVAFHRFGNHIEP